MVAPGDGDPARLDERVDAAAGDVAPPPLVETFGRGARPASASVPRISWLPPAPHHGHRIIFKRLDRSHASTQAHRDRAGDVDRGRLRRRRDRERAPALAIADSQAAIGFGLREVDRAGRLHAGGCGGGGRAPGAAVRAGQDLPGPGGGRSDDGSGAGTHPPGSRSLRRTGKAFPVSSKTGVSADEFLQRQRIRRRTGDSGGAGRRQCRARRCPTARIR